MEMPRLIFMIVGYFKNPVLTWFNFFNFDLQAFSVGFDADKVIAFFIAYIGHFSFWIRAWSDFNFCLYLASKAVQYNYFILFYGIVRSILTKS